MIVYKKRLPVEAVQLKGGGQIQTDRGEYLGYVAGDWLLTSQDGQQWPVSDSYFRANYESEGGAA